MTDSIDRLTERQKDCLRLVSEGYISKEIGRLLGISPATVDNHVRAALEVLRAPSRAEAARMLRAHETDQALTSQPAPLAEPLPIPAVSDVGPSDRSWWSRLVPAPGGARNTLSWEDRNFAILRVALAGLIVLVLATLGLSLLLWALR